jgi:hypothetical protein
MSDTTGPKSKKQKVSRDTPLQKPPGVWDTPQTGATGPMTTGGSTALPTWAKGFPPCVLGALGATRDVDFPMPRTPVIIILYAGKDDSTSLESAIHSVAPWLTPHIIAIDSLRGVDMLTEQPFSTLFHFCNTGQVAAIIGGPNCRTWSIRRHIPKPGGGHTSSRQTSPALLGINGCPPNRAGEGTSRQLATSTTNVLVPRSIHVISLDINILGASRRSRFMLTTSKGPRVLQHLGGPSGTTVDASM